LTEDKRTIGKRKTARRLDYGKEKVKGREGPKKPTWWGENQRGINGTEKRKGEGKSNK